MKGRQESEVTKKQNEVKNAVEQVGTPFRVVQIARKLHGAAITPQSKKYRSTQQLIFKMERGGIFRKTERYGWYTLK